MAYWDLAAYTTLATFIVVLASHRVLGTIFLLTPLFALAQWQTVIGTLWIVDSTNAIDAKYALVVAIPTIIYCIASTLLILSGGQGPRDGTKAVTLRPTPAIYALLLISVGVTVAYFNAVGYNVFTLALQNMAGGGTEDYTTLRLESYSGSRYLFPGYVNQFKNAILPALTVVILVYAFSQKRSWRLPAAMVLIPISVVGIMGTGQRSALFMFFLTMIVFLRFLDPSKFRKRLLMVSAAVIPLLMLGSVILGRSANQIDSATGTSGQVGVLGQELLKRLFYDNQWSGLMAFHYTEPIGIQDGREWLTAVLGILPGQEGTHLASDVFKMLYGTDRGTAPPSLWGSVHFNFGFIGLILLPILLAFIFAWTSRASIGQMNTLQLIGMSGVTAVTASWVASGPEFLLNTGVVTYAVLWYIGSRVGSHPGAEITPAPANVRTTGGR